MNMTRTTRALLLALVLVMAALNLSCNVSVGVGFSAPMGYGGWGAPYGGVYVGVPIYP